MDIPIIVARLLHVGLGVFWAGAIIFNAVYLAPSIRDAGPDGAKVAAGLLQRRFADVMPVVALVTILSGLFLLWRASAGFSPDYMSSSVGMTYSFGALFAIVAFIVGVTVMRPAMLGAAALARSAASAAPEERERALARAQILRVRAGVTGRVIAWLLAASTVAMAVARYV